jgi:type IV pilus assembly protein PilF
MLIALTFLLNGCVTSSTSTLTKKANPETAVQRYVQLGLEYIKRDDLHRARKHLTRALSIDPEDASANAAFGLISHQDGERDIAEASFLKAIASDEGYTRGRTYYAAFLFSEKRFKEALQQFEIASNDTGYVGRAQIFTNIALCNTKLHDYDAALNAYQKTLRLERSNGRALSGITELLIQKKDFKRAQQYYNQLVRMIRQQGLQHSAQSLWQGIRIADYFQSNAQEASLVMLLEKNYPNSNEYSQYLSREQARNTDA